VEGFQDVADEFMKDIQKNGVTITTTEEVFK
jgi:phytoene dehydrogenase-like protein